MRRTPTLKLKKPLEDAVRRGHPWVFRDALTLPDGLKAGEVVDLLARDGAFLARGTVEPDSPLTFRAWTTDPDVKVDAELVVQRLTTARDLRREVVPPQVTGFRLCHGENDHIPGLQCDMYDGVASLRTDGLLGIAWEKRFVDAVLEVANPRAVVIRNPHHQDGEARVVHGKLDGEVVIDEGSRRFTVDILRGQKTGFFLDQRENRDRIAAIAAGRNVLNLFAYTGGFSVAAALAGASRVVTVDIAKPAIETARRNFTLNHIPLAPHAFEAADAFDVLETAARSPGTYDLILVDPPSFAPNRKSLPKAQRAYDRLNLLALQALAPGGWLASASCSSHFTEQDLMDAVTRASLQTRRPLTLVGVHGASPDHPRRLNFPEGHYLSFLLLRAW
jgi:23S rRNA (cytosine1962-C5)-methyltransferase